MTKNNSTILAGEQLEAYPLFEGPYVKFRGSTFDIFMYSSGIGQQQIHEWENGKIKSKVAVISFIPFLFVQVGSIWLIQKAFNFLSQEEEIQRNFFESDPNVNTVNFVLVDYPDPVVRAIRTTSISLDDMAVIREACFDQLSFYMTSEECDRVISHIKISGNLNFHAG